MAKKIGFPLIIKAAFGGGGRGIKVARTREEIPELYESAVREATARISIVGDVHRVQADDPRVATSVVSSLPRATAVDSDAVAAGSPVPVSVG